MIIHSYMFEDYSFENKSSLETHRADTTASHHLVAPRAGARHFLPG